ncbi:hypothetical protein [Bacillus pumilus]|uniref:hypothetical protein n=1 Tax=Bacillus pumilus TaxID=1408 RepID=UPI00119F68CA|nr:hypothetical protein [Bacillus pumilus]
MSLFVSKQSLTYLGTEHVQRKNGQGTFPLINLGDANTFSNMSLLPSNSFDVSQLATIPLHALIDVTLDISRQGYNTNAVVLDVKVASK